jgi:hypothetical protein
MAKIRGMAFLGAARHVKGQFGIDMLARTRHRAGGALAHGQALTRLGSRLAADGRSSPGIVSPHALH